MAARLSARLNALAGLVAPGARLADVGTDHGYIPVYLCQMGVIPGAIALDINRGPLQRAKAHVAEYGLQDQIDLRLSDGLTALTPGEVDTILIAGMGGALIRRILANGAFVLQTDPELILQPQSEIPSVRVFLREIGYVIVDEGCVLEGRKFYFYIKARRGGENIPERFLAETAASDEDPSGAGSERQCLEDTFGPVLLKKKPPEMRLYLEHELAVVREICGTLTDQIGALNKSAGFGEEGKSDEKKRKLEERLCEMKTRERLIRKALDGYR